MHISKRLRLPLPVPCADGRLWAGDETGAGQRAETHHLRHTELHRPGDFGGHGGTQLPGEAVVAVSRIGRRRLIARHAPAIGEGRAARRAFCISLLKWILCSWARGGAWMNHAEGSTTSVLRGRDRPQTCHTLDIRRCMVLLRLTWALVRIVTKWVFGWLCGKSE